MGMVVYLDTCALNRLTDNQSQSRIRAEAEAVESILGLIASGAPDWAISSPLLFELGENPDPVKRAETLALLVYAQHNIPLTSEISQRAIAFERNGLGAFDAVHLALCEAAGVDFLLTVDDRFLHRAATISLASPLQIVNPVDWWARRRTWQPSP